MSTERHTSCPPERTMTMSGRASPPTLIFSALELSTAHGAWDTRISRCVTSPGWDGASAGFVLPPHPIRVPIASSDAANGGWKDEGRHTSPRKQVEKLAMVL